MNDPIHVVLIDDHPMVLEGLKKLLAQDKRIAVKATFRESEEVLQFLTGDNHVDVVLLDINLPGMNGFELCKIMKKKYPSLRIIALSTHNERTAITRMIQNGASGYLSKSAGSNELIKAVYAVLDNNIYLGEDIQQGLAFPEEKDAAALPKLTRREKQILSLVAEGKTTPEIAEILFLSALTVETHRRNMMQKFSVSNSAALVRLALENGLL